MAFPTVHWVLIDDDYYMPLVEVTEKSLPFLQNMKQAAVSLVGITQGQFDKCIADMPENIEFRDKRLADSYYGEATFVSGDTKMKLKGAAYGSFKKALVTRGLAFAMTLALYAAHCATKNGIPGWSISELRGLKTNLVKAFQDAMQTFPGSGVHNYEVVKNEEDDQEEAEASEEEDDREVAEGHGDDPDDRRRRMILKRMEEEEAEVEAEEDDDEVARLQRELNEAKAEIEAQREEAQKQKEVAEKREAMKKLVKQAQAQVQAGKVQAAKRQTPPPGAIATLPKRPKASIATPTMPNMAINMSAMAMMGMGAMAMMGMGAMANSGQTMFGPSSSSPPPASSFPSSSSSRPPMLRPRLELRLAQQARDAGDEGWEHL